MRRVPQGNTRPECCQVVAGPPPRVKIHQDDPLTLPEMPASVYKQPLDSAGYLQSNTTEPISRTLIKVRKPQATFDVTFTHPAGRYRNVLLRLIGSEILGNGTGPL